MLWRLLPPLADGLSTQGLDALDGLPKLGGLMPRLGGAGWQGVQHGLHGRKE